jgi:TrmH family RNA methyltransferase
VGTILRTIDAVGASGLLLLSSGETISGLVDPYLPGAVRASMGALFWRPVIQATFKEFTNWSQKHGYHIYGTSAHGAVDYMSIHQYEHPAILLLGSERAGLSAEQAEICDQLIQLPMHGHATSLNLAVAAGVMLYELLQKLSRQ